MLALKMWSLRLFVLLCFLGLAQQENAGKQLFRSKMINTIWAKAQNKMSSRKLDELHQLLETQDKAEMELKKERASGGDRDGAIEAKLRKTLRHILETYGLAGRVDVSDKERGMNRVQGRFPKDEQHTFGDRRLDSLWKAVQKQGEEPGIARKIAFLAQSDTFDKVRGFTQQNNTVQGTYRTYTYSTTFDGKANSSNIDSAGERPGVDQNPQ